MKNPGESDGGRKFLIGHSFYRGGKGVAFRTSRWGKARERGEKRPRPGKGNLGGRRLRQKRSGDKKDEGEELSHGKPTSNPWMRSLGKK